MNIPSSPFSIFSLSFLKNKLASRFEPKEKTIAPQPATVDADDEAARITKRYQVALAYLQEKSREKLKDTGYYCNYCFGRRAYTGDAGMTECNCSVEARYGWRKPE